jgi:hypothetical protein
MVATKATTATWPPVLASPGATGHTAALAPKLTASRPVGSQCATPISLRR